MKVLRRFLTVILVLSVLLMPSFNSYAKEKETYTYTVTFYSGVQGDFSDGDEIVHKDLPAGSKIFFNAQSAVSLGADSKYYVKGVRLSGRDNAEAEMSSITVDVQEDADYVVVYGIKGEQVKYTVHYQDEKGNELAPSDVFYGNVGDKPVVAYKYIEGYVPEYRGMTKTLSVNEAENVFTFVYKNAEDGFKVIDGQTIVIYKDTVSTVIIRGGAGGGGGTGNAGTADEGEEPSSEGGETQESGSQGEEGSQEIVDLDDEDTPLGNLDLDNEDIEKGVPMLGIISLVGISIIALIAIVIFALRIRERRNNY